MEAYKVKYGTRVRVVDSNIYIPPASIGVNTGDDIKILRLDGMYCNAINSNGDRIYISAFTEVEIIPDEV